MRLSAPVEGLVVALVDDRPLARERMSGHQRRRRRRILDDPGHRPPVQFGRHPVGLDVEEDIAPVQRPHHPALGHRGVTLLGCGVLDARFAQHVEQ